MNINDYKDVNGNVLVSETLVSDLIGDLNTHKADNVSQAMSATRDATLTGIQRITTTKKPKVILINGAVNSTYKKSVGSWAGTGTQYCIYDYTDALSAVINRAITISDGIANRTQGTIENVTDTGFDINWSYVGTGATGAITMSIICIFHGE